MDCKKYLSELLRESKVASWDAVFRPPILGGNRSELATTGGSIASAKKVLAFPHGSLAFLGRSRTSGSFAHPFIPRRRERGGGLGWNPRWRRGPLILEDQGLSDAVPINGDHIA